MPDACLTFTDLTLGYAGHPAVHYAAEAGLPLGGVLYSDALSGPEGPASTYVDLIRTNASTITTAISAN